MIVHTTLLNNIPACINIDPNNIKILGFNNNCLSIGIFNYTTSRHYQTYVNTEFEKVTYYEILHNSPLWTYEIIHTTESIYNKYSIVISINENLVDEFINKSIGLTILLSNQYKNLQIFRKFDNTKHYLPSSEMFEPTNFKIKLFDYQKKSLKKMIEMETNTIEHDIKYSILINYNNLINVKYDPIQNIISDKERTFKIKSRGGILADDMGLGKTITTLALVSSNPSINQPKIRFSKKDKYWKISSKATLILCPSHITKQWENEVKKANPSLKVLTILTKKDHEKLFFKDFIESDIIITSHQFIMNFKYYPCINYRNITPSMFNAEHRNSTLKDYYTKNVIDSENIDDDIYETIKYHELPLFEFFHFHRLVLDEGHEIFGEMLQNISQARFMSQWLNCIDSNNYWYISGSPFVNWTGLINCVSYLNLILYDDELKFEINSQTFKTSNIYNNILNKEYLWNNILEKICIRHKKSDVSNEIKLYGYNENIEWIDFTELEKNLYKTKETKLCNTALQQLCCHPLILDSCRKVFGDIDVDLSVMQEKLVEYHTKQINDYTIKLSKLVPTNQAYHMLKKSYENILTESKYMLSILNKIEDNVLDEDDNSCSICLEVITDKSITKCGHIFCAECIKNCLKYKSLCPMCKKSIEINDVYLVNKKEKIINENVNPLIEKYGSKLGKIISMIRTIVVQPESRIIIFSQWDFMLSLIGKTLSENGIANCFVKGNVWSRNSAINKFKNGKNLSGEDNKVIMLSLENCASGTNLTEATHIFFVEPINASKEEVQAIEGQAIGRACRLGQKQKVEIFRVLIKDTIEEEIYNTSYKN
jgi:SNF2 family DNA or RNA helicase